MASRSRILYVTSGTAPGCGPEALHAMLVARALSRHCELDMLCPMLGRQGHVMEFYGARLMRVPLPEPDPEAFARAVHRQLADGIYDAVHVRSALEGAVALALREQAGFTLVFEPSVAAGLTRSLDPGSASRMGQVELDLAASCDLLLVHGTEAANRASRLGAGRTVDLGHGVDTDVFVPQELVPGGPARTLLLDHSPDIVGASIDDPWGQDCWTPRTDRDLALVMCAAHLVVAVPPQAGLVTMPALLVEAASCGASLLAPRSPAVQEVLEGCDAMLYDPGRPLPPRPPPGLTRAVGERVRATFPAWAVRNRLARAYADMLPLLA